MICCKNDNLKMNTDKAIDGKVKLSFKSFKLLKTKMSLFPLYDILNKEYPEKDLSIKQKEEFVSKIEKIDDTGKDLVYSLIQFYRIENENEKLSETLPYKGIRETTSEKGKEDLSWCFTDFPIKLRHILHTFIKMHVQSMEEEKLRQDRLIV